MTKDEMTLPMHFDGSQFKHLSAEDTFAVKNLVYKRAFQEGVIFLRTKYKITLPTRPPKNIRDIGLPFNAPIIGDITFLLMDLVYEVSTWSNFCYYFITYGAITEPEYGGSIEIPEGPWPTPLEYLKDRMKKANALLKKGDETGIDLFQKTELKIYDSPHLAVEIRGFKFFLEASEGVMPEDFQKAYETMRPFLQLYGKRKKKTDMNLDLYYEVALCKRMGKNDAEIATHLGGVGLGKFKHTSIRVLYKKARGLGY